MKKSPRPDRGAPHRFFHSMVLMGGSLALGCGGIATTDGSGNADPSGTAGSGTELGGSGAATSGEVVGSGTVEGSGGAIGAGGAVGTAGSSGAGGIVATGGTTTTLPAGSGGSIGVAGSTGSGGSATELPPCPSGQWACSEPTYRPGLDGWQIPQGCTCNASRPASSTACKEGERRVCAWGSALPDGTKTSEPVPFNCGCVALPLPANSCDFCLAATGWSIYVRGNQCDSAMTQDTGSDVLCGMAVVSLI